MKFFEIMRPTHWTKNVFVFAALIFGKKLFGPIDRVIVDAGSAVGAFLCFSLAASAIYIFNDIIDRKADASHPEKKKRPIAVGDVTVSAAAVMSALCALVAVAGSWLLTANFAVIVIGYILLMVFYSVLLKRVMILDCIIISLGFCLRAIAGAVVIGVDISPWLIICTFALCLDRKSTRLNSSH
jgi:4-hydroxybenzoate polyprenyltransferase